MPDFVNGDERCNNLMTIVFDCGTSKGNGNSKQEVCNLMQLFYAHYHFEDYTDKDVLEMMTFICEDIISSGNHKISSFGSIDGAFKALSPGFESIFEAHCDNNERRPFPKFIDDMQMISSYIQNSCLLYGMIDDTNDKYILSCGVRIAYDKFVELSNNLKEKEYLFHDDLEQLYNMYLTIITLTRYNELMGKPKLKDFLNMAYEFAKKYED